MLQIPKRLGKVEWDNIRLKWYSMNQKYKKKYNKGKKQDKNVLFFLAIPKQLVFLLHL